MISKKAIIYPAILLAMYSISCKKTSKVENKVEVKSTATRKKSKPLFVNNTAASLRVQSETDLVGLWSGRFDTLAEHKELYTLWAEYTDSLYEAGKENGEDYLFEDPDINGEFYQKIDNKYKKYIDTDAQFGFGYIIAPNKISIIITSISDSVIIGKSICAGNERPLQGKFVSKSGDGWEIVLNEPGTNKYDGSISFRLNKNDTMATGVYMPFDTLQQAKEFTVYRKNFKYDTDAKWIWSGREAYIEDFNPSTRLFTVADVENQPKSVLRLARNSIYARHGYSFKKKDVRNYFENFEDYIPVSVDVRKEITTIEVKNEALLKRYEEYANNFYDGYGR